MTSSGPTAPTSKDEFLTKLRQQREHLQSLTDELEERQMTASRSPDRWSIKDTLAHIAEWEMYMVRRLAARRRGEAPEVWGPGDQQVNAINQAMLERNRDLTVVEVRRRFRDAGRAVVSLIQTMTEDDLLDDAQREAVIGPWQSPVWLHLAANTYLHYEEHAEQIKAWLSARGPFSSG
jgi:hypothetical protein